MSIVHQLKDLRLRTNPCNTKKQPELDSYLEASIMLGEPTYSHGKFKFTLPDWDFMCERPITKMKYRYALAITAVCDKYGLNRRDFFDFGYPMYNKTLYSTLPTVDTIVQGSDNWTSLCVKAKYDTGNYNDVYIVEVYNPFYTWLEYYENGILLNPENIIASGSPKGTGELMLNIQKGWNPELCMYMPKPFNIVDKEEENGFDI